MNYVIRPLQYTRVMEAQSLREVPANMVVKGAVGRVSQGYLAVSCFRSLAYIVLSSWDAPPILSTPTSLLVKLFLQGLTRIYYFI